jgi:two-component system cell cycle response regulator
MPDEDDDLLRTDEVPAVALEPEEHETVPIDIAAATNSRRPRVTAVTEPPSANLAAHHAAAPPSEIGETWLDEETSLTRATEKTLSVPAKVTIDRATVTVITGLNAGQVFALDGFDHVIGRGTEADVWVEDPAISRRHARIVRRPDGRYYVEDLGSTNGTFVAGRRIEGRCELANGDRIQVGPALMIRFAITDDAEEALQRRLYESSTRDALTRSFNRKYLGERLIAEIAHARRHKTHLALLMMDIDRFKAVNDTHGHLTGDMVLRIVAAQVARLIRVEDVLARYGGEEFVILIRSTALKDARVLADRVRWTIEALKIPIANGTLRVTTSIGIASLGELPPEAGATELLAAADARLYRAKASGRNCIVSEG